jgi:EpsI family protein
MTTLSAPDPQQVSRRIVIAGLLMACGAVAAVKLQPHVRLSEMRGAIHLEEQVPSTFGEWRVDSAIMPVLPNPEVQARMDKIYTQTLSRTYVNRAGQRVMLTIAYGNDQNTDATAVHRPEYCYTSQGFQVQQRGIHTAKLAGHELRTVRLVAAMGPRIEPIIYWVTLDEKAILPGFERKLEQLSYGLRGNIADGMLVRISTVDRDEDRAFAINETFLAALEAALPANIRHRYFGS